MESKIGSNQSLIKYRNQRLIINEIRSRGGISRSELAKKLQLSNPSISKHVEELLDKGVLCETGSAATDIGRRPIMLEFNGNYGCVVAIELVNNDSRIYIADMRGERIDYIRLSVEMPISSGLVDYIILNLQRALSDLGEKAGKLCGICIAVAGRVDRETGRLTYADGIENFRELELKEPFKKAFGVPVVVKNSINLAILGERSNGLGKDMNDFSYYFIDHTFDLSAISSGKLLEGANAMSCNVGQTVSAKSLSPDVPIDSIGIQRFSAGNAFNLQGIARLACKALNEGQESVMREWVAPEKITFDDVARAYMLNDQTAFSVIMKYTYWLATVIYDVNCILDSGLVIIGGGITKLGNSFASNLESVVGALSGDRPPVRIRLSELLGMAVISGGVDAAITCAIENLIKYQ